MQTRQDQGVLARLEAIVLELPEAIAERQRQRDVLDREIATLKRLSAAMGKPAAKGRPKRVRVRTESQGGSVKVETVGIVAGAALSFDGLFTINALAEVSGIHRDRVRLAINRLREQEFVGAAGPDPESKAPRPAMRYRVMDLDALASLRPAPEPKRLMANGLRGVAAV